MEATTPAMLDRVADHIDGGGIQLLPAQLLSELVIAARAVDASEVVIGVLVDPTEPAVARERAFAKLAARIIGRDAVVPAAAIDGAPTVVLAA